MVNSRLNTASEMVGRTELKVSASHILARGERSATDLSATSPDVSRNEASSKVPIVVIIPMVSKRPCRNLRGLVFQMRQIVRSMTLNIHEPAHNSTMNDVISRPVETSCIASRLRRTNSYEPGKNGRIHSNA